MGVSSGQRVTRRRNTSPTNLRSSLETGVPGLAITTYADRGDSAAAAAAASATTMKAGFLKFPRGQKEAVVLSAKSAQCGSSALKGRLPFRLAERPAVP